MLGAPKCAPTMNGAPTRKGIDMRNRFRALLATVLAAAVLAPAAASAHDHPNCPLPTFGPGDAYHPHINRSTFTSHVDNPYFPLAIGTTWVYTGVKDGKQALDIVIASRHTRLIDGVRTRVVEDRLYLDGALLERTADYIAQDVCGNVWYFGEDTAELDQHGKVVDTSGSFHAGVGGAQPGVIMESRPELGRRFRQEWSKGEAEDTFKVIDRSARVTVPFGSFKNALRTEETTRLEPNVVDNKYYVRGVGEVSELALKGEPERLRLVEVIR
jgi:hypothetical protein